MGAPRDVRPRAADATDDAVRTPWTRITGIGTRFTAVVDGQRRRRPWFDHLARAGGRYTRTQGDLMAAGVTYFVFLGLFPVLLLVASIIALVLSGDALLQKELHTAIREAFPGSTGRQIVEELRSTVGAAGLTGLLGAAGFLYAGLRAMDKLRIGMERTWKGTADEPEFWKDNLADLVALVALGAAGLASIGLTGFATQATAGVLTLFGVQDAAGWAVVTNVLGIGVAFVGDVVVFLWLLRVVPSTRHPLRLLLPGALFGAAGFEVMKLLGSLYLSLISGSVTSSAFGGAVGILVWINIVIRFAFFTAAWTATLPSLQPAVPDAPEEEPPVPAGSGASPVAGR
ncbi:membrane protein [Geodermatophilus amargosae]|uniref:Membrane protein n=1 Tax=Geodermatophilus amargosae TaxID=1296565 RepID=A0A1I6Y0J7_9ACTN|nr:YihY/virulence factor BrkB family protein [Geodermatophilus amargosae]SFT44058.1 membrane protein [Geodermatophilus amargosae]